MPTEPGASDPSADYLLDNRAPGMGERLSTLARAWDPWTISHLEACGVKSGWHCLEVGAGGGSIARWLSDRVGPGGSVLATDLEPRHAEGLAGPNLEVRQHNIANESLPEQAFDFIHSRLVLQHIRPRARVVKKLVRSLRPGGWICLEDFAGLRIDPVGDPESVQLLRKGMESLSRLIRKRGGDPRVGRKLVPWLASNGIEPIRAEIFGELTRPGSPGAGLAASTYHRAREELLREGLLTKEEFDRILVLLEAPNVFRYTPLMLAAWGPKPQ